MDEVVLHIGMHKTGTTSIQTALAEYDDGVTRMARFGHINHSIPVTTLFSSEKYDYHVHKSYGRSNHQIDALRQQWQAELDTELAMPRKRLIICGEKISLLERAAISRIRNYFLDKARRIRIIAYVREPVSFASSAFQEQIQGGNPKVRIPRPGYRNRFEKFIDIFGRESVEFVLFEPSAMLDGSVISDFCQRTNIQNPIKSQTTENKNSRPSRETTQLTYLFNRSGMKAKGNEQLYRSRALFLEQLRQLFPGPGYALSASQVLESANIADIQWMETISQFKLLPTCCSNIDSESSAETDLEQSLLAIDDKTITTLQTAVTDIDSSLRENNNPVELLNFLFSTIYFQQKLANDRVLGLTDIKTLFRTKTLWRSQRTLKIYK